MKKLWIMALTICAAVLFTACGKSVNNNENTAAAGTQTESQTGSEEETSPAASQEAPGAAEEFKILKAKVKSVSDNMDSMTVINGDAENTFDLKDSVVETSYALEPDAEVSVIYKGEISGSSTANAKVVMVLDAQEDMKVLDVTGNVMDQAMSTFVIKTEDGREIGFLKDNFEGQSEGVLGEASGDSNASGDKVKVTYVTVSYDAGSTSNFPLKVEAVK